MPNYEEIIQQSQVNIKSLSDKLQELDKLHQDIKKLIKQPKIFDAKYQQIVKLTKVYTNTLGASTKKYLDGNNTLFTTKLSELSIKTKDLQKEITRLSNTDYEKLFNKLQKDFIDKTSKDLAVELEKFDKKSNDLQLKIDMLKEQVERLESIDLEKHFDKLQRTLSEIFGAINSINLTITAITQTLNSIVQSLGEIRNAIDSNHIEVKQIIDSSSEATKKHLEEQDNEAKKIAKSLESNLTQKFEKVELRQDKQDKQLKLIKILGIVIIIISVLGLIAAGFILVKC